MNRYHAFDVSEIGYSHISSGIPKQDNSGSVFEDNISMASIADGHGSVQYIRSDRGSKFAVEAFFQCASSLFGSKGKDPRNNINKLKIYIKNIWEEKVKHDIEADPFSENELSFLKNAVEAESDSRTAEKIRAYIEMYSHGENVSKAYGSTLIGIAARDDTVMVLQIGDGICVAFYDDGSCDFPVPPDKRNMANITSSISSNDPGCRVYFFDRSPVAVFAASDGLDDSYGQGEQLFNFYRKLCVKLVSAPDSCISDLQSVLAEISEKGSRDDMSIAGIYDLEELTRLKPVIEKNYAIGRLKFELYNLQDTDGGVSDYSLNSKKAKYEKADTKLKEIKERMSKTLSQNELEQLAKAKEEAEKKLVECETNYQNALSLKSNAKMKMEELEKAIKDLENDVKNSQNCNIIPISEYNTGQDVLTESVLSENEELKRIFDE